MGLYYSNKNPHKRALWNAPWLYPIVPVLFATAASAHHDSLPRPHATQDCRTELQLKVPLLQLPKQSLLLSNSKFCQNNPTRKSSSLWMAALSSQNFSYWIQQKNPNPLSISWQAAVKGNKTPTLNSSLAKTCCTPCHTWFLILMDQVLTYPASKGIWFNTGI